MSDASIQHTSIDASYTTSYLDEALFKPCRILPNAILFFITDAYETVYTHVTHELTGIIIGYRKADMFVLVNDRNGEPFVATCLISFLRII